MPVLTPPANHFGDYFNKLQSSIHKPSTVTYMVNSEVSSNYLCAMALRGFFVVCASHNNQKLAENLAAFKFVTAFEEFVISQYLDCNFFDVTSITPYEIEEPQVISTVYMTNVIANLGMIYNEPITKDASETPLIGTSKATSPPSMNKKMAIVKPIKLPIPCFFQPLLDSIPPYDPNDTHLIPSSETFLNEMELENIMRVYDDYPHFQGDPADDIEEDVAGVKGNRTTLIGQDAEVSVPIYQPHQIQHLTAQFMVNPYTDIIDKWYNFEQIRLSVNNSQNQLLMKWNLPEDFFAITSKCALPQDNFLFGAYDFEIRVVPAGHQFMNGLCALGVKYDTYGVEAGYSSWNQLLTGQHALVNLAYNNETTMKIPFLGRRPFIRHSYSSSTRPGKYATLFFVCVDPPQVGIDTTTTTDVQVFVRMINSKLSVPRVQGNDENTELLTKQPELDPKTIARPLREPKMKQFKIPDTFRALTYFNASHTADGNFRSVPFYRTPGYKAPQTSYENVMQMARLWGVRNSFSWATTNSPGSRLASIPVDPTIKGWDATYKGIPTPLEYITGMYNYWRGTIEFKVTIVATEFHRGTIACCIVPNEDNKGASTLVYEKAIQYPSTIFNMQGQESTFTIEVPYNNDSYWSRTCQNLDTGIFMYNQLYKTNVPNDNFLTLANVYPFSLNFYVVNDLNRPATCSNVVTCFVWNRAGENYQLMSLKTSSYIDEFYFTSNADNRRVLPGSVNLLFLGTTDEEYLEYKYQNIPRVQGNDADMIPTLPGPETDMLLSSIFKRPVPFCRVRVSNTDQMTIIPILPPSRTAFSADNDFAKHGFGCSPTSALLSCFRWWRGTQKLILTLETDTTQIVYITFIPRSGAYFPIGERSFPIPPRRLGYSTEIMAHPSNKICTFEIPYETENIWTPLNIDKVDRLTTLRDLTDSVMGHLVIECRFTPQVSINWAAGDDFEVSNFIGIPYSRTQIAGYVDKESLPKFQSDPADELSDTYYSESDGDDEQNTPPVFLNPHFQNSGADDTSSSSPGSKLPQSTFENLKTFVSTSMPAFAGAITASIPGVGIPLVTGYTASKIGKAVDNISNAASTANITMEKITSCVQDICGFVKEKFNLAANTVSVLFNLFLDLFSAFMSKSWAVMGIGFIRVLSSIFSIPITNLTSFGNKFGEFFNSYFVQPIKPRFQSFYEYFNFESEALPPLFGIIGGLVSMIAGKALTSNDFKKIPRSVLIDIFSHKGVSHINSVIVLMKNVFSIFKTLFERVLLKLTPEGAAIRSLFDNCAEVRNFVKDSHDITTAANNALLINPTFRTKAWMTVMRAYQLQKLVCDMPLKSVPPMLTKVIQDTIHFGNEKFCDISASPVRFEPFVICLQGKPGIGKSFVTEQLGRRLLKAIGFKKAVTGLIYYRQPNCPHWNNYRDQPIVCYDDYINTNRSEEVAREIGELYELKSTSHFTPPMAELGEKKIKANPLIVILVTNNAFPMSVLNQVSIHPEAVLRRRDLVVDVAPKEEFLGIPPRELPLEIANGSRHLTFRKYNKSTDSKSLSTNALEIEEFSQYLEKTFEYYYSKEKVNVQNRLSDLYTTMGMIPNEEINLDDPFRIFYDSDVNDRSVECLPSEKLELKIDEIMHRIKEHSQPGEIEMLEKPTNPFIFDETKPSNSVVLSKKMADFHRRRNTPRVQEDLSCSTCDSALTCFVCKVCKAPYCFSCIHKSRRRCVCQNIVSFGVSQAIEIPFVKLVVARENYDNRSLYYNRLAEVLGFQRDVRFLGTFLEYYKHAMSKECKTISGVRIFPDCPTIPTFQGESEWDIKVEPSCSTDTRQETLTELDPDFNDEQFEKMLNVKVNSAICLHGDLPKAVATRYHQGYWHMLKNSPNEIKVSECPCAKDCKLDVEQYKKFIMNYIKNRKHTLSANITNYYNTGDASHLDSVPICCRPKWTIVPDTIANFIKEKLNNWIDWISDKFAPFVNYFKFFSYVVASCAAFKLMGFFFGPSSYPCAPMITEQGQSYMMSGSEHVARVRNRAPKLLKAMRPYFAKHQGVCEDMDESLEDSLDKDDKYIEKEKTPSLIDTVKERIYGNIVKVDFITREGQVKKTKICANGICGHYALINRHYVETLRRHYKTNHNIKVSYLIDSHNERFYSFDEKDFTICPEADLALWKMPPTFRMFKDIRKFVCTVEDYSKSCNVNLQLLSPPNKQGICREIPITLEDINEQQMIHDADNRPMIIKNVLVYDYGEEGLCGAIVLDPNRTRPIMGIHCAGFGSGSFSKGYAAVLTQESITIPNFQGPREYETWNGSGVEKCDMIMPEETKVDYVGALPKEQVPFAPVKTDIVPSAIHKQHKDLMPTTEPCILTAKDPRYKHKIPPLVAGCMKHGKLTSDFKTSSIEVAKDLLYDMYFSDMKVMTLKPKRLSYEDACVGLPGIPDHGPIRLSTSAGWPYNTRPKTLKSDYITFERDVNNQPIGVSWMHEDLVRELNRKEQLRKEGVVPLTFFTDTLKDERRKPEKLMKEGGTRVFCSSPFDYTIAARQNWLHFCGAFYGNRHRLPHAVGINAMGPEWTQLVLNLKSKNQDVCSTMDYSNFGPGFNSGVAKAALDIMNKWTLENVQNADETELSSLAFECIHSTHVMRNTIYRQMSGSPSGAAITTVINSLVNMLYIILAWLDCNKGMQDPAQEFKDNVCLYVYGDDLIMSVTEKFQAIFNARTIHEFFSQHNIVATNADKTDEIQPFEPYEKATFLKRGIRPHDLHPGYYTAPLDWVSIVDCTQWVTDANNLRQATQDNCKVALELAHQHGKTVFNNLKQTLNKLLKQNKINTIALSWDLIDRNFFSQVYEENGY